MCLLHYFFPKKSVAKISKEIKNELYFVSKFMKQHREYHRKKMLKLRVKTLGLI